MPYYATNTLTPEDKRRILSVLPTSSTHIFAMARGQIYHAPFNAANSGEWKPLDLRGAIIFGRDSTIQEEDDSSFSQQSDDSFDGAHDDDLWFRLVELEGKKGPRVVWRQPVSVISSDYKMLVPFFHVFSGNSRMFGFRFEEDDEASRFYETVMIRTKERPLIKPNPLSRSWSRNVQRRRSALPAGSLKFPTKITNPDPGSFKHCAHLGLDDRGEIIVEGEVDKKWSVLFNGAPGKNKRTPSFASPKKFRNYLRD